jgi:DNA-binding response OmpR family regulator
MILPNGDPASSSGLDLQIDVEIPVSDSGIQEIPQPAEPAPAPSPPPTAAAAEAKPRKILVVDDEDDIRLLISRVLSEKGFEVVTAGRGLEAIQQVQTQAPDMIILDAMLPEVHGFDICKKIKGSKKYGHIPVIMISAIYRGWRYAQDLKDSYGVDEFIEKPFKIGEFMERVQSYFDKHPVPEPVDEEDLSGEAEGILAKSVEAYKAGDIDRAIELLRKGLAVDPLAFKLHYNLGLLLGRKGLNYQAIRELENALELSPDYFPALKNLALLYQKAGFKFKSIETWERALHYCPDEETRDGIKQHLMSLL